MARLGYNNLALNIGLAGLIEQGMITSGEETEYDNFDGSTHQYTAYTMLPEGMRWIVRNYELLNLKVTSHTATILEDEEDIKF